MVKGIGIDIAEVQRIKNAVEKYKDKFSGKIFTEEEVAYSMSLKNNEYVHLAARFAVKEAFSKAIGTGITKGFKFREVGVINKENGEPVLILTGDLAEKYGRYKFHVSISHTDTNAVAVVVMEEVE
ncbi:MAG: holo-[acyl-carrier-protein] synthase [Ignavibacteria bacterium GWF2_33_9]|nr:MAG: holo-[acyl-carrier-protein] synthase [Ignavibacteria bacterium GWF2_33_9]